MQTSMQCTLTQQSNGDFSLLASITNPNRNIDVRFELFDVELFFSDRIISTLHSALYSGRREGRLESLLHTSYVSLKGQGHNGTGLSTV
ncbi:hypothetical protein AAZV13_17G183900 [Glycine max]